MWTVDMWSYILEHLLSYELPFYYALKSLENIYEQWTINSELK